MPAPPASASPTQGATRPTGSGEIRRSPRHTTIPPTPTASATTANTRPRRESLCALLSECATSHRRGDGPRVATMLLAATVECGSLSPPRATHDATMATEASDENPVTVTSHAGSGRTRSGNSSSAHHHSPTLATLTARSRFGAVRKDWNRTWYPKLRSRSATIASTADTASEPGNRGTATRRKTSLVQSAFTLA